MGGSWGDRKIRIFSRLGRLAMIREDERAGVPLCLWRKVVGRGNILEQRGREKSSRDRVTF